VNGWKVELSRRAQLDLRSLGHGPRQAALDVIDELSESGPALFRSFEMRGLPNTWKVRFHHEDYRMIYLAIRASKRILVKRIRPRATAYEGMKN
jgi:mRNA-degrading endonuclease RelE of RelBE toxin-antitoxin system